MQFFRFVVGHDLGEKAMAGRGGWMFFRPGVQYLSKPYVYDNRSRIVDPTETPYRDDPVKSILTFRDQLARRGVELLVVIAPGKASVYPDMLTAGAKPELSGKITHSLRTISELRGKGIAVVDLFGPLARERAHDAETGDSVYLRTDTHWRARGARTAARVVADIVRQYPWYNDEDAVKVEYVLDTVFVDREGDVGVMSQLPAFRLWEMKMHFPTEKTRCYQVYSVARDDEGEEISRRPCQPEFRKSRIVVIGDSFSRIYHTDPPRAAGWVDHLAFELSEPLAEFINDGGASTLVRQELSRKTNILNGKKLLIWEFVERDIRFGAEGWQDVEM
jgi:hypothetical protein